MKPVEIIPGVYQLSFGFVNAFLIADGGLTLIDTGIAGSGKSILQALAELGYQPQDLKQILITHLHRDHTGAAREVQEATGAKLYMHPVDAADYCKGVTMRPRYESKGVFNRLMASLLARPGAPRPKDSARVDGELADGETLPFAGGLKVIHTPGHTAGHVVLLYPKGGGVLFGGDACSNFTRLGSSMMYEDANEGLKSLQKIATLEFETACLSHGRVMRGGADEAFRKNWKG
jgi:glyoxylase-like metal-dependent hydrolase (beta-lactamase superfamily II)